MFKAFVALVFALVASAVFAVGPEVARLQQDWAEIKYKQPKN